MYAQLIVRGDDEVGAEFGGGAEQPRGEGCADRMRVHDHRLNEWGIKEHQNMHAG